MKISLSLCLAVLAAGAGNAQILRPEAVNGALLGGIAGAVIGHNSGDLRHNAWRGAAIGAGTGLILGEMAGNHRASRPGVQVPVPAHRDGHYIYRDTPAVQIGFGYGHRSYGYGHRSYGYGHRDYGYGHRDYGYGHRNYGYGHRTWGDWAHHYPRHHGHYSHRPSIRIGYGYYPGYDYGYYPGYDRGYYPSHGYSSYGVPGLFWGGLAGAIIGHNSGTFGHNAWRGAAWGAGTGWLLGTIADANRRAVAYEPVAVQPAQTVVQPAAQAQPQQVTIINNYYNVPATPMAGANGLFGRN